MEVSNPTTNQFTSVSVNSPSIIIHIAQGDSSHPKDGADKDKTNRLGLQADFLSWTFVEPAYNTSMLHQLNFMRSQGFLTDVKIIVEGRVFPCHKVILAGASEFFLSMFQSRPEADEVSVTQIAASTVELLLQYLYTGKIELTLDNFQALQTAAAFFRVPSLCKGCADFISMYSESVEAKIKSTQVIHRQQPPSQESSEKMLVSVKSEINDATVDQSNEKVHQEHREVSDISDVNNDDGSDETNPIGAYKCDTCGLTFRSKRALNKHTIFHGQPKVCVCKFCGKIFNSVKELGDHAYESHSSEKAYICQECGKSYVYPKSLKDHMKVHTGTDLYVCSECGKSFIRADYLREHSVCHTGVKPHKCDTCGKAYSYRRDLSRHKLTHLDECPFKCEECGKGFSSQDCFRQHKFTHTGQRPYVCDLCSKSFFYRGDLHRHKRQVHELASVEVTELKTKLMSKISRLQELKKLQKSVKKYECDECGQTFNRSDSLLGHKHKHTGKKRFACDFCDRQYVYKRDLVRHKSAHHPMAMLSSPDPSK
ncbi:zinc finger protein 117-like [Ptychodera flava]|uniref:zinc finger protein 117-like n=1 Tax=Ptychodera flava TaxID=63121 RepID=UPI00396A0928